MCSWVPRTTQAIITALDIMLLATIGDRTAIGTTRVPIGGIGTGGIAAGTGIELSRLQTREYSSPNIQTSKPATQAGSLRYIRPIAQCSIGFQPVSGSAPQSLGVRQRDLNQIVSSEAAKPPFFRQGQPGH